MDGLQVSVGCWRGKLEANQATTNEVSDEIR
jgi:hypothetical protein